MGRTLIAYFSVDEDKAFSKSDGPISYFEKETKRLEQSGIILEDAAIADADATDPREAYLVYLARFAFDHFGEPSASPMTYEEWTES